MRLTSEIHLPYHDPGIAVEAMRRSGMGSPFITWMARNLPRQVGLAPRRPGQLAAYHQIQRHSEDLAGGPVDILPPWVQEEGPIGLPGGLGWLGARTPESDLATLLPIQPSKSGEAQAVGNLVGSLAPFVQALLGTTSSALGHPLDIGRYISTGQMPSARQNISGLEALALSPTGLEGHGSTIGPQGKDIATTSIPRWLGQLYQFVDPTAFGHLSNVVSSAEGVTPQSVPESFAGFLTNEPIYPANSPADWQWSLINKEQAVKAAQKDLTTTAFAARLQPPDVAQAMLASKQAAIQRAAQDLQDFVARMQAAGVSGGG
jgi:hypothetical protein